MSIRLFLRHFVKPKLVVATLARDQNIGGKNVRGLGFQWVQAKINGLTPRMMKNIKIMGAVLDLPAKVPILQVVLLFRMQL